MSRRFVFWLPTLFILLMASDWHASSTVAEDDVQLRRRLKDEHAEGTDLWIYNDLARAMAQARIENKPIFVTFRCVPCKACAGFDAEVAQGSEDDARISARRSSRRDLAHLAIG